MIKYRQISIRRMVICMKKISTQNTTEVFAKTLFHYVPEILKYIDEIKDPRKKYCYSMKYLIISEMLMFLSEGKSQRFTEKEYKDTKYLENISKIVKEKIKKVPNAEIYTDVFSKIEKQEIEKLQYKINYNMIRNKIYYDSKVYGTRFQKANKEVSSEWLYETIENKKTWYLAMLEMKLVANDMEISMMSEMIRNEDRRSETEERNRKKEHRRNKIRL